jgi:hypothetical protein
MTTKMPRRSKTPSVNTGVLLLHKGIPVATKTPIPASKSELCAKLTNFPHIVSRIDLMWGCPECRTYLYGLAVVDGSKPNRQGFPFEALDALVLLLALHDQFFPQFCPAFKTWG